MPAQDGARGDQAMVAQVLGQPPDRAAKTARSAQSSRGLGLVRRSTATSCRSTSSSTSLVEDLRPSSRTSPSTCWKIRYSSRSDTAAIMPVRRRRPITAGQGRAPSSGTPHADRCPLRVVVRGHLGDHPHRPLTQLRRVVLVPTCHDSISSEDRVSGHAGGVHTHRCSATGVEVWEIRRNGSRPVAFSERTARDPARVSERIGSKIPELGHVPDSDDATVRDRGQLVPRRGRVDEVYDCTLRPGHRTAQRDACARHWVFDSESV